MPLSLLKFMIDPSTHRSLVLVLVLNEMVLEQPGWIEYEYRPEG